MLDELTLYDRDLLNDACVDREEATLEDAGGTLPLLYFGSDRFLLFINSYTIIYDRYPESYSYYEADRPSNISC